MAIDSKVNILLVDDNPANLLTLEATLESLGQNLVKARSGREALRRLLEDDFALILLDIQMPELDGLETAALIRERNRCSQTPIIFLTAYERTDLQVFKGYSLGAVDYLIKPIVPEVLRSKVAVFVELFRKTEQVKRQAEQLRQNQQREHERQLSEERQRWEMERLREESAREKKLATELARTVADRTRAEKQAQERARQQALVADLGRHALAGTEPTILMNEAVTALAQILEVDYGVLLELQEDGETLRLRAGVGWREDDPQPELLRDWTDTGAAYALRLNDPVIVEDLAVETRFNGAALAHEHGVASGVSVVIRGRDRPFGVLGVHSRKKRGFSADDVYFLRNVANVLATAIERKGNEEELARLRDALAIQLADITRLHQLSMRLSNTLELQPLLEEVLAAVMGLLDSPMGELMLYDPERNDLYAAASAGLAEDHLQNARRIPWGQGAPGAAIARRLPVLIEDVVLDPLFAAYLDVAQDAGYRSVYSSPLVTRGGEVIGALGVYFRQPHRPSDRERGLVEWYTRQAADVIDNARLHREIQDASRRKDEFLAMLAHELRNPLAPIVNALHILRLRGGNGPGLEPVRELAERQVRHLTRLVDDLLDVSRITRGKIQLRKEPLELGPLISRTVESTLPFIQERGLQLDVAVPPQPIRLEADPTRLEQVLTNLLNNAAKYTETGGRIWLSAAMESGQVVLRVRDTGIGMAPETMAKIFDLFMQDDRSLERAQGGLGIGLTLVRSLVELHGGTIKALSAGLGQGSEFVVRLPALLGEPGRHEPECVVAAAPADRRPVRVLVVDDNRAAARSLTMLLRIWGYLVETAHDGPAALQVADQACPEVVLLDIGLPGIDGYQVARQLRQRPGMDRTLIVAVTGYGQEEDRHRAQQAGFDHHLIKPVDPSLLREFLDQSTRTAPRPLKPAAEGTVLQEETSI